MQHVRSSGCNGKRRPRCSSSGGGGNGPDNCQILCVDCHVQKTVHEQKTYVEDATPLMSRFSVETYGAFVGARKPPQAVADLHVRNGPACSVDIKRCRYNGLVQNTADLPIYSPTDEIEPCTPGHLGDYHWGDIGPLGTQRSLGTVCPYWGRAGTSGRHWHSCLAPALQCGKT